MSENPNKDFISVREEDVMKKIRAHSRFFSNVTVLTCAAGDTNAKITQALAQLGLFVVVEIKPRGKLPYIDDSTPWPIWITITETPATNRGTGPNATGKTCRMALEEMAHLVEEVLGIAEAEVEPVDDPIREIVRIAGKILMKIEKTNQEQL